MELQLLVSISATWQDYLPTKNPMYDTKCAFHKSDVCKGKQKKAESDIASGSGASYIDMYPPLARKKNNAHQAKRAVFFTL
jgi:hypothetical protein